VKCSELVNVVGEVGDDFLESLTEADALAGLTSLGLGVSGISSHLLPMVKDALREGTAGSGSAEGLGETEGLGDGKVSLDHAEGSSLNGLLTNDHTATLGEAAVNATYGIIGGLDFDEEDRFLEAGVGGELGGEEDTAGSGGNLTSTAMDSISVESDIGDVETDSAHSFVAHDTLLGGLLEGRHARVLDLAHELALLGDINEEVGAGGLGAEAPNLLGIIGVPLVLILEDFVADLDILLGVDLLFFDSVGKLVAEGLSSAENTVMLVGRLGEAELGGLIGDGLLVGNDGVTLLELALGELLFEILKANLDVELTATGDNVLTRLLGGADDEGVRLGELAEAFNELGEVGGVLHLDGDTHDGGDGEAHNTDAVGIIVVRDGSLLDEVSINTDETDGVTARDIGDGLNLTSHHEDGTLDVLDVEVSLGSGLVVGAHNADLLSSGDDSGEDTSEGEETATIGGGHHLGDEDHKRSVLVALLDSLTARVIDGAFVKVSGTVALGFLGGGELHDDHLKESLSSVDPLLVDALHEGLESELLLISLEDDVEGGKHLPADVEVAVHDVAAESDDGLHDELNEAAGELGVLIHVVGGEALLGGVEVVVAPELLHELLNVKLELGGVDASEAGKGEGPAEKGGTEGNGTDGGVDLLSLAHIVALVGGDDNVGVLNDTLEVLVHGLTINLELEDTAIDLVNEEDGLDLLTEGLTEHGFGLHADTLDVIDDDESAIGDTEGSGNFGGEINVTGGVDKVDKVGEDFLLVDDVGLEVERDTSGLDGDTTLLLVLTGVGGANVTSLLAGDNSGLRNEGVGKSGLSVIDVSNNGNVTDLIGVSHDRSDLVNCEVWHVFSLEC
jgi:hypothetical protein